MGSAEDPVLGEVALFPAPPPDAGDAALMRRLAAGEAAALGPLYRRHAGRMRSVVLRVDPSMSHEEADDVVQEAFLTLHRTAGRYREMDRLESWLIGIAVRTARGWRRRRWVRQRLLRDNRRAAVAALSPSRSGPGDQVGARVDIERALAKLPAPQREVLVLHTIEGLSGQDIAQALGIRTNTVWTRLHRARQRLAEQRNREAR